MATNSWSSSIRKLLVDLLNEANAEVREAHENAQGKAMKKKLEASGSKDATFGVEIEDNQRLAVTVPDKNGLDQPMTAASANTIAGNAAQLEMDDRFPKRVPEQPARLIDRKEYRDTYDNYDKDGTKRKRNSESDTSDLESSEASDSESEFDEEELPDDSPYGSDYSSEFEMGGSNKNDTSRQELMRDEHGERVVHSRSTKQLKDIFEKLTGKDQEDFDQD